MRDRTLKIALAISLLVNLFVLGAVGGGLAVWLGLGPGRRPTPAAVQARVLLRAAADDLTPAERMRFRAMLREVRGAARPIQHDAQAARRQAADLFVQPHFDPAAVDAALGRARAADFALRTKLETAVVDFAKDLPQDERQAMARALARGGPLRQPPPPAAPQR